MTPETSELAARIIPLRDARMTWDAIGRAVGKSATRVRDVYREAMAIVPPPEVTEAREEHLRLTDVAMRDLIGIAANEATSDRTRVEAWRAVGVFSERASRLLGLDMPQRREVQVITIDAVEAEIARLDQQLGNAPREELRAIEGSS